MFEFWKSVEKCFPETRAKKYPDVKESKQGFLCAFLKVHKGVMFEGGQYQLENVP